MRRIVGFVSKRERKTEIPSTIDVRSLTSIWVQSPRNQRRTASIWSWRSASVPPASTATVSKETRSDLSVSTASSVAAAR